MKQTALPSRRTPPMSEESRTNPQAWGPEMSRVREPGPLFDASRPYLHQGVSTRSVHAGQYDDPLTGAIGTPIYQNSTFYLNPTTYEAVKDGRAREHFIYARYGNPSQWALQEKLANLDQAESALAFSSGMAAISTALFALLERGAHVVTSRDLYGGTYNLFNEDFPDRGLSATYVDPTDPAAVEAAIRPETKLLFFESLTNPLLKLTPVRELVAIAKRRKIRVVIDNTFLSPLNYRPLEDGVDLVVHSASKYLNGHSDLIAGVAAGSRKLLDRLWAQMLKLGGNLDPHACFLLERGLKTYALRLRAQNHNAAALARFLESREEVARVYYPGLENHRQHALALEMLDGHGGMVAFEVKGGDAAAHRLLANLNLAKEATSLGGVESLVSLPYNTSQAGLTSSQRRAIGINPGLVRLSVGIEDAQDLIEDMKQALQAMEASS